MKKVKELFKIEDKNLVVEYEVMPLIDDKITTDPRLKEINQGLNSVEERLIIVQEKLDNLNSDIDRLTNHADGFDYMIAVASGIIAGVFDHLKMGEFSLKGANEFGQSKVEEIIKNVAKKEAEERGYTGNVDSLEGAVRFLEDKFTIAADTVTNEFGGGKQHHLRDFSHHASLTGMIFSLLTQFTGKVYGTDTMGNFQAIPIDKEGLPLVGNNFFEKFTFGIVNWFFHMISDVAGASTSISANSRGTGLPGPLLSLLKEFSALPIFSKRDYNCNKAFSLCISKLFNGTLFARHDENGKLIPDSVVPFDLRTEIGIVHHVGQQAIPIIMNECIVRGFYFLRRLYLELRDKKIHNFADLKSVNWKNILPHNNRTIARMLTISTGTFTAINFAGAAINAARKPGGLSNMAMFFSYFILKVNFVGVGRFAVACYTDIKMGFERRNLLDERMRVNSEILFLNNAKVFYKQADMWIVAENASIAIEKSYNLISETKTFFVTAWNDIAESINAIGKCINKIEKNNPGMKKEMLDIMKKGNIMDSLNSNNKSIYLYSERGISYEEVSNEDLPGKIGKQVEKLNEFGNRVNQAVKKAKMANDSAAKASYWKRKSYLFGLIKTKDYKGTIEDLQTAVKDLAKAEISAAEALQVSFENEEKIGQITRALFALGVSNIAANRSVVNHLKKELEGASESKLNEMAKQEVYAVISQLKAQEDLLYRIDQQAQKLFEINDEIINLKERLNRIEKHDKLFFWKMTIDESRLDKTGYFELDIVSRIVCLVRDFFDITKGIYDETELLFFKLVIRHLGIQLDSKVSFPVVLNKIMHTQVLKEKLMGNEASEFEAFNQYCQSSECSKNDAVDVYKVILYLLDALHEIEKVQRECNESLKGIDCEKEPNIGDEIENSLTACREAYSKGEYIRSYCLYLELRQKGNIDAKKALDKYFNNGSADVQYSLGIAYEKGDGVEKDMKQALKWYRKATKNNYAAAQFKLGVAYDNGEGYKKNDKEAVRWYRKAAEQGYASAQNSLGVAYENGEGLKENIKEAVSWYRKAAEQDNAKAQYNLGMCYLHGDGVRKNRTKAKELLQKAADQGDSDAIQELDKIK